MARTQIDTEGILSVQRNDFDITTPGQAVVAKIIAGAGITLSSTGVDSGTGDVTINGSGVAAPVAEVPTGTVNGVNTVFTLSSTPSNGNGVIVLLDGNTQYNGSDYSVSGNTITFTQAPASPSTIFAYYGVLAGAQGSGDVTLTGTQTLTNKTLTSPQLNSPKLDTTSTVGYVWTATDTAGAGAWSVAAGGGVSSVGTISGTGDAEGASISGSVLTLHAATGTTGGILTTGDQSIGGTKTFDDGIVVIGGFSADLIVVETIRPNVNAYIELMGQYSHPTWRFNTRVNAGPLVYLDIFNLTAERSISMPDTDGTLVATVNGLAPDSAGNVVAGDVTLTEAQTLTNKRINPRVVTGTTINTLTVNSDTTDLSILTAQQVPLTIAAPTGTPVEGQKLMIRVKDNGTARVITWNAIFRAIGVTLPTTTVISKTLYLGFIYNSTDTKWDVIALAQEA